MDLITIIPRRLPSFVFPICILYIAYLVLCRLQSHVRRRRLAGHHNCGATRTLSVAEYLSETEWKRFQDMQDHAYLEGAQHRYKKFGNTFRTSTFSTVLFNTIEPRNIKAVLSDNFLDYSIGQQRKDAFRPLLEDGIFNSDGNAWAQARKLIRPCLVGSRAAQIALFEPHVNNFIQFAQGAGGSVDLQELFFKMTLDVSSDLLFNRSCFSLVQNKDSVAGAFAKAFSVVQSTLGTHLCLGRLAKVVPEPGYKAHLQWLHHFVDDIIGQYRATTSDPSQTGHSSNVLPSLDDHVLEPVKLRGQLMSLLLAGRDTTASLLSSLWHVLSRRPDIWATLQGEITLLEGKQPDHHHLANLTYLRGCINECK